MSVQNSVGYEGYPVPVGTIVPFFLKADKIPLSWELCDGRSLVPQQFTELFATIGYNYSLPTDPVPTFRLPSLSVPTNYIQPFTQRSQGLLPPEIATNTPALITAANLPPLTSGLFTTTQPQVAYFAKVPATQPQNVPLGKVFDAQTGGMSPSLMPTIVSGGGNPNGRDICTTATASAMTAIRVGEDEPLKVNINEDYPVQYGGISCLFIMKVIGLTETPDRKRFLTKLAEAQAAEQAALAATAVAVEVETEALLSPVAPLGSLVVQSNDSEAALAAFGQGGGTTPAYSNEVGAATYCPALSGFLIPPKPTF